MSIELGNKQTEDSIILYEGPYGLLVIPKTVDYSKYIGRDAVWCIAAEKNNQFLDYIDDIYIWRARSQTERYMICFNMQDGTTEAIDRLGVTLNANHIAYFRTEHPVLRKLFERVEQKLVELKNPNMLVNYAITCLQDRWKEAEPIIFDDADASKKYLKHVIKKEPYEVLTNRRRGIQPPNKMPKRANISEI